MTPVDTTATERLNLADTLKVRASDAALAFLQAHGAVLTWHLFVDEHGHFQQHMNHDTVMRPDDPVVLTVEP